jgi:hypothetical protein
MITLDLDFADIRTYPPVRYPGIVVLRPGTQNKLHLIDLFKSFIAVLDREPLPGYLWVVDESGIRFRGGEFE